MPIPRITVLMSVYNGEKYLQDAIDSILTQTYTNFEFIIIDDASTDSTPNILKAQTDSRIRLIINEQNIGFTKCLNKGLSIATGEYIARMDADDISLSNRFATQLQFFYNHPEFALIGSSAHLIDEKSKIIGRERKKENFTFKDLLAHNQIIHGSTIIKKQFFDKVGGYNENIFYTEDLDLWLRLSKNYKVGNVPEILYQLRLHKDSITKQKSEELALYRIVTVRINCNTLDGKIFDLIKKNGILNLVTYLNKKEMVFYYNSLANMYIQNGDIKTGRDHYLKIFRISPFNVVNIFRIIRSYFGKKVISETYAIYKFFENKFLSLKNKFSM